MAQAKTIKFGNQTIVIGNGATPEVFISPCGLTSLTMTINVETNDVNVPDCSDPNLPSWLISDIVSQQMEISGDGVMDTDSMQVWRNWWMNGGEKNVRWITLGTGANGGGYYSAPAVLVTYEETGERGTRWNNSISLKLNGKPTFTANP